MKKILSLIICGLFMVSCVSQEEILQRQQENEQFIQENIDEIDRKLIEETEPYEVMKTVNELVFIDQCKACNWYDNRGTYQSGPCVTEISEFPESIQDNLAKLLPLDPKRESWVTERVGHRYDENIKKYDAELKSKSFLDGFCQGAEDQILFKVAKKMLRKDIANDELFFKCIFYENYSTDECIIYRRNHEEFSGVDKKLPKNLVDYKKYFPTIKTEKEFFGALNLFYYVAGTVEPDVYPSYGRDTCESSSYFHNGNIPTSSEIQECNKKVRNIFNSYMKGTLPSCNKMKEWADVSQSLENAYKNYFWENKKQCIGILNAHKEFENQDSLSLLNKMNLFEERGHDWSGLVYDFILMHSCKPDMNDINNRIIKHLKQECERKSANFAY